MSMHSKLSIAALLLLASAAVFAAQPEAQPAAQSSIQPAALAQGGTWQLAQLDGQVASGAYLRFADKQVQGNDGCNQFRGAFSTAANQALRFDAGSMAGTLMACAPEQEKTAQAFKQALTQTQNYRSADNRLELLGAEQKVLAVLVLQSEKLAGSKWQLQGLNNGKQAVVSQASLEAVQISFLPAGKLQISTPCGAAKSYYRLTEAKRRIHIRKPRADGKVCAKTDAAYAEFKQLKKALKNSDRYQITGDQLELRSKNGALQISAQALR